MTLTPYYVPLPEKNEIEIESKKKTKSSFGDGEISIKACGAIATVWKKNFIAD